MLTLQNCKETNQVELWERYSTHTVHAKQRRSHSHIATNRDAKGCGVSWIAVPNAMLSCWRKRFFKCAGRNSCRAAFISQLDLPDTARTPHTQNLLAQHSSLSHTYQNLLIITTPLWFKIHFWETLLLSFKDEKKIALWIMPGKSIANQYNFFKAWSSVICL